MAIGAGGGSAGAFGNRSGGGRARAVGRFGGSRARNAVEAALRWFAIHQSPNGQWDMDGYQANCTLAGPKCEPATLDNSIAINRAQDKQHVGDVAMTSYAVLCFLGAGYDHQTPNKHRRVVRRGLDWLRNAQNPDGTIGETSYEVAIAAMALVEAYGMTNDPNLRGPGQQAIDAILARQVGTEDGYGSGWSYFAGVPTRIDGSVTGWNVMALKSTKAAGLNVAEGMDGSEQWLETVWKAHNPQHAQLDPYSDVSGFPYTYDATTGVVTKDKNGPKDLTCVGALCAVFLGKQQGDPMLDTLINNLVDNQMQTKWPLETYYLYYSTLAVFQAGGDQWKTWNDATRDMLVDAQRREPTALMAVGTWALAPRSNGGNASCRRHTSA